MHTRYSSKTVLLPVLALLAAVLAALAGCGGPPTPVPPNSQLVLPSHPEAQHGGKTYSQWAVAWWQWAFAQPAVHHPLLDTAGADATQGQSGNVWFLGGTFNTAPAVTRNITIPAATALFFPLYTWEADSFADPELTVAQRIAMLDDFAHEVTDLTLTIDGITVPGLAQLRAQSGPTPFTAPLPVPDDLFSHYGADAVPATLASVVADGYWAFIEPLARGRHIVVFGAEHYPDEITATYNITVE